MADQLCGFLSPKIGTLQCRRWGPKTQSEHIFFIALLWLFTDIPSNLAHLQRCWNEERAGIKRARLCSPLHLKLPHFMCLAWTIQLIAASHSTCASSPITFLTLYNLHNDANVCCIWCVCACVCMPHSCRVYPFLQFIQRQSLRRARGAGRASWRAGGSH